ncbi:hypothetical protein Prum_102000 [Phytohabitans rumicis]|uniref:Uncharacterized protein n=1 Tax=Phytohabitans rumicis TaxID=1076125 RepID=A0A6V8LNW1_9ACTN|nr:hypothetical protein Prum_102000 [Phytohabitans rumicis]
MFTLRIVCWSKPPGIEMDSGVNSNALAMLCSPAAEAVGSRAAWKSDTIRISAMIPGSCLRSQPTFWAMS